MDLEALRKINNLTGELQRHGMSFSSEDALQQAQKIIEPLHETNVTPILHTSETTNEALLEKKYQLMLDMNNKKFEQTITTLNNNMIALNEELIRIKTEMSNLRNKQITETKQYNEEPTPVRATKKESHPRQGSFAPGDISIEKIFYCGTK